MKARKIVAVKFNDGTERKVNEAYLRRYLDSRELEAVRAQLFPGISPSEMRNFVEAYKQVLCEEIIQTNRKNASTPRNKFAKDPEAKNRLLKSKKQFERDTGRKNGWGWKAAACRKFLIDPATLERILARP